MNRSQNVHREDETRYARRQDVVHQIPMSAVPESYQLEWLSPTAAPKKLKEIAKHWRHASNELTDIIFDVWCARQRLQCESEIAVLRYNDETIGVIAGYPSETLGCYYVQHVAVHPAFHAPVESMKRLIEGAMDRSLICGFHGWTATDALDQDIEVWQTHGFYQHDDFTLRRMGYFTRH